MTETILGIHCTLQPDGSYTYDGNVALVRDGRPLLAVGEERVSRRKHDGGFRRALAYVLERAGIAAASIDQVAVSTFARATEGDAADPIRAAVREALGTDPPIEVIPSHHEIHAVSAACQASFEDALVAVLDNEGSVIGRRCSPYLWRNAMERTSYFLLRDGTLELVARDHDRPGEIGYGKAYSKITRYAGFESYHQAGKTMGLAPFGDPRTFRQIRLFVAEADGRQASSMGNSHDGIADVARWFTSQRRPLPPPRSPGEPLRPVDLDLASWIQEQLEASVVDRIGGLLKAHGTRRLCLAGGVALNSVMNRRLAEMSGVDDLFVPPAPGDSGLALGAAAWVLWRRQSGLPRWPATSFLGGRFSDDEIERAIADDTSARSERCDDVAARAAQALAAGKIVAWFAGASEYGPRALGHRSILAHPGNSWTKDFLNHMIKGREWFRPYAPSVLAEAVDEHFDGAGAVPFMMKVARVRPERAHEIAAAVHVDGTARLQTVDRRSNPEYAALLDQFRALTGLPTVLNTSFNLAGMPIVETPRDALDCLRRMPKLSALYIGSFEVTIG